MRIGWVIPTIGTFGAVREMIEISNALISRGHKVYIYHPDGTPCKWLLCKAEIFPLDQLPRNSLDVLIGIVDWKPELYSYILEGRAKVKAICLMGFDPTERMAASLRGDEPPRDPAERILRDAIEREFLILADSNWQLRWLEREVGVCGGAPFGGINLEMFKPSLNRQNNAFPRVLYSGDPRDRKGTDVVERALTMAALQSSVQFEIDSYWGRRFSQERLVDFLASGDIFVDGHRRAGWCNPVLEAMACGCVPVCTRIGATQDFAIHEETALVVPVDDGDQMLMESVRLIQNPDLLQRLRENGLEKVREFSYDRVVLRLENFLQNQL